jgi:hypothetical protein
MHLAREQCNAEHKMYAALGLVDILVEKIIALQEEITDQKPYPPSEDKLQERFEHWRKFHE